jgi:hypothetical protein
VDEWKRHRQVTWLNISNAPPEATHVATLKSGIKYFVRFDEEGTCWIQPSDQYGEGYAFCSLYQEGVTFQAIRETENGEREKDGQRGLAPEAG